MKKYEVTMMATSYKTITVEAESEQDALRIVGHIEKHTDLLRFTDEDVDEVAFDVCEADPDEAEDVPLEELIKQVYLMIANTQELLDDVKAMTHIVEEAMEEV